MKRSARKYFAGGLVLLLAAAAGWWWLRRPTAPPPDLFRRLPGGFVAAWQANASALRRSPLVRQALQRAAAQKADPAYLKRLGEADWISGVILPGGRTVVAWNGRPSSTSPAPAAGSAADRLAELAPLPQDHDLWLVMDPRAPAPLAIGPINGVTVELPGELLTSARRLVVFANVGTLSVELEAQAEYSTPADATRLASTLNGFLGLVKGLSLRHRSATTDQAIQLLWDSLEVKAEGTQLTARVKLGEAGVARLLLLPGP